MREVKPTQKPVPSSDIKDLFFNSGLLDIWATSLEHKYIDRFGNCHLTAAGMEWLFKELVEKFKVDMNTAIVAAGYITIDSFQQGAGLPNNELTQRNHILRDETTGEYYRWDGDLPKQVPAGSTPQSTGGIGKGAWVGVGDASLRSQLATTEGASLVTSQNGKSVEHNLSQLLSIKSKILKNTNDEFQQKISNVVSDASGGRLYFPASSYTSTESILKRTDSSGKIVISGESRESTVINHSGEDEVFSARERNNIAEMSLIQTEKGTGVGVRTPNGKQLNYNVFDRLYIKNFLYGMWFRYSIWSTFRDLHLYDNTCGIRFSRNEFDTTGNPAATGIWNSWSNGYYHNVNVVDNVCCEGGEVGIWGSTMCTSFRAVTCQGQKITTPESNKVLPVGMYGIGMLLDNGKDSMSQSWNNHIESLYVEATDIGLYIKDKGIVTIDGYFMQGGTGNNQAKHQLYVDNSNVLVRAMTSQDWFESVVKAVNNSTVVINNLTQQTGAGKLYEADNTSRILSRGECDMPTYRYRIKSDGVGDKTFTLPRSVSFISSTDLDIHLINNGNNYRHGTLRLSYYNGNLKTLEWIGGDLSSWVSVDVVDRKLKITLTGGASRDATVYLVERFNSNTHPTEQTIESDL